MEHLTDKDSTVPTPGSLTLSAVVSLWLTGGGLEKERPSSTAAHQEAALGFLSDIWLFTSAAQGSHLWSSENQESRKRLYSDAIDMGIHPERF